MYSKNKRQVLFCFCRLFDSSPSSSGLQATAASSSLAYIAFQMEARKNCLFHCDILSVHELFLCAFWGKFDFTKKLKTRFFPLKLDFFPVKLDFSAILCKFYTFWWILEKKLSVLTLFKPFLLTKLVEKGKNLQFLSNLFSKIVKLILKKLRLVFKMLKLIFKTPKLPWPAFSLQGLGWIPHKKSLPSMGGATNTCFMLLRGVEKWSRALSKWKQFHYNLIEQNIKGLDSCYIEVMYKGGIDVWMTEWLSLLLLSWTLLLYTVSLSIAKRRGSLFYSK